MNFLIYHSGFVSTVTEEGYDPGAQGDGIDTLIASLHKHQVQPNSNVYAELGSTWRFLMRDPGQAAHALGKLFLACGENNVLWGTDSIWYGSPQDQMPGHFRTFQISEELRQRHGYPEITPALRAKVFGLNAAKVYRPHRDRREAIRRARRGCAQARPLPRQPRSALQDLPAEDTTRVHEGVRPRG